jgi:uncharacterized membrane protein
MTEQTTPTPEATPSEGMVGVGLLVAAYVDERGADQALEVLKEAKRDGAFYYDDAAVVRRDAEGKVHINETGDMRAGKGAAIGAVIGGIFGLLGGPAGVAIAASAGAALGAAATANDAGFDDRSLKAIGGALPAGTSALAVTTSKAFIEAVRAGSTKGENLTMAKDIAAEIQARLNARQDLLMTLVITEEGLSARKVISSPSELQVFGITASDEGVVAMAAVADEEGVTVASMVASPEKKDEKEIAPTEGAAPAAAEEGKPDDAKKKAAG